MVDKSRRDRPKIEITDEMIEIGAAYASHHELPLNEAGFALAMKDALIGGVGKTSFL